MWKYRITSDIFLISLIKSNDIDKIVLINIIHLFIKWKIGSYGKLWVVVRE